MLAYTYIHIYKMYICLYTYIITSCYLSVFPKFCAFMYRLKYFLKKMQHSLEFFLFVRCLFWSPDPGSTSKCPSFIDFRFLLFEFTLHSLTDIVIILLRIYVSLKHAKGKRIFVMVAYLVCFYFIKEWMKKNQNKMCISGAEEFL